jgi:penicillin V acylase-like amidase (Ntn superfamily)
MTHLRQRHLLLLCVLSACLLAPVAVVRACSTFCLRDGSHVLVGKNFVWYTGEGFLSLNPRHFSKTALVQPPELPIQWTATYGSVTFNQIGREFPFGGMNEAGLVVELLWLSDTRYPAPDARPALNELQWVQYQLDTAQSVADVLRSDAVLRITQPHAAVHYFVCDRAGSAATVEFLDGRLVAHTGAALPVAVLTNSRYARSLDYLSARRGSGVRRESAASPASLDRFVRAATMVEHVTASAPSSLVDAAFGILAAVAQGSLTQWQVVYDMEHVRIVFTTQARQQAQTVALNELDFACARPREILELNGEQAGQFTPYDTAQGQFLLQRVVSRLVDVGVFRQAPAASEIAQFARYPDSVVCHPEARENEMTESRR